MTTEISFTEVFTSALRGVPTTVVYPTGHDPRPLPVATWSARADAGDHALLDLCRGSTLDVGCGPGRLTLELTRRGHHTLGVDVVAEAVLQTRRRGASAVMADVFDRVPEEGRWSSVLLADGNVGIAGDPTRLLDRVREVLHPTGRAVVEVAAPGAGSSSGWTTLEGPHGRSRPFRWAHLSVDDAASVAAAAGMRVRSSHQLTWDETAARWAVVLEATP